MYHLDLIIFIKLNFLFLLKKLSKNQLIIKIRQHSLEFFLDIQNN